MTLTKGGHISINNKPKIMKNLIFLIMVLISVTSISQELEKNPDTGKFEYTEVVDQTRTVVSFKDRMTSLGYKNVETTETSASGNSLANEQVMGFVVEMIYDAVIEVKDGRYRIKITNVHIKDTKGTYILEDMGGYQKKWLKKFNNRLPEIVSQLKKENAPDKW